MCIRDSDYVCDWVYDEHPYPMRDGLTALPTMLEMDDLFTMSSRRVTIDRFAQSLKDGFDAMYRDGASNGRLMSINLHPWLIGQPFRIGYLEEALGYVMGHERSGLGLGQKLSTGTATTSRSSPRYSRARCLDLPPKSFLLEQGLEGLIVPAKRSKRS